MYYVIFETIDIQHGFTFTEIYSRKNEFRFSKLNKLKYFKLFKVLWTTY